MKKVYVVWYTPKNDPTDLGHPAIGNPRAFENRKQASEAMEFDYSETQWGTYSVKEFVESNGSTPVVGQLDTSHMEAEAAYNLSEQLENFFEGGEQAQRKLLRALGKAVLAILVRGK
jgi:hypothetical protein